MATVPDRARVVIVGGGIVGCSIAYHLALRGETDVVLLEQSALTAGTTWHAAGLVGQLRATENLTRLAQYTAELFADLEHETGQATGFQPRGSVSVAADPERLEELKRGVSMARLFGLAVEVITPDEVQRLVPHAHVDDLIGGVHLPGDGVTNPVDTTIALAKGARARGVTIVEHTRVDQVITEPGRVRGVRYTGESGSGEIVADVVVNAAGMWAPQLVCDLSIPVPLHAAEHFYVVTDVVPGLAPDLPVLRDPDRCTYVKGEAGKLLVGWFEPIAKPWGTRGPAGKGGVPETFSFSSLLPDLDHIAPLLELAAHRVPLLADIGIQLFFNGPESFTPDDRYLLGPAPGIEGLFLACGFNSVGIQSSGGAGKVLADWILDGRTDLDLWDVDVRRMMPFQGNPSYLRDRTTETLGLLYAMHWPYRQPSTARGARRTPLHDRLVAAGACFGEVAGWERANWFGEPGESPDYDHTYGRPKWLDRSAVEHRAVREDVGLFDLSSFAKFAVVGDGAERLLNRVCSNDVSVAVGRIVYTQWLNERGTIEADVTVTRESEERYLVVSGAASQVRDRIWLERHAALVPDCEVLDVTSGTSVLAVMGPRSRELLQPFTTVDLGNESFPFGTSKVIDLGYAQVRASRITYVGELGWELYVPSEFAVGLFDVLTGSGDSQPTLAGYHALNSLRMEKGYRHWGHDITTDDSPIEAGLEFAVAWDKPGGFIGLEALAGSRRSVTRRLVLVRLADPYRFLYHNEPIWRDDALVGRITSGMFGHTVGTSLGLGYVALPETGASGAELLRGRYEVEIACERTAAEISLKPWYDPQGLRIKS